MSDVKTVLPAKAGAQVRMRFPVSAGMTTLILLVASILSADINLKVSVEPREASVGDHVQFKITIGHSPDIDVKSWPEEKALGPFEVVGAAAGRPRSSGKGVERDIVYTVAAYEAGVSTLPAVSIVYALADGTTKEISTPEIPVAVRSVLGPDDTDIRDIKGPVASYGKTALWALALAALVAGAYLWRRRRKAIAGGFFAGPPPRPAHETALETLAALEGALAEPAKIFYSRLTDALRLYVESRFGVSAMDRTTSELFQEFKRRPEFPLLSALRGVLDTGDLAKFAKWDPAEEERCRDLERVKTFVLETKPAEALPEEKG